MWRMLKTHRPAMDSPGYAIEALAADSQLQCNALQRHTMPVAPMGLHIGVITPLLRTRDASHHHRSHKPRPTNLSSQVHKFSALHSSDCLIVGLCQAALCPELLAVSAWFPSSLAAVHALALLSCQSTAIVHNCCARVQQLQWPTGRATSIHKNSSGDVAAVVANSNSKCSAIIVAGTV